MTNHPTTTNGEAGDASGVEWLDASELHKTDDAGVFNSLNAIRRGTLAELVAFVLTLPENQQADYAIQKSGDRRLGIGEIRSLSLRSDYPGSGG